MKGEPMRSLANKWLLLLVGAATVAFMALSAGDLGPGEVAGPTDLGDGLVLLPGGQVVEAASLPGALGPEEVSWFGVTDPWPALANLPLVPWGLAAPGGRIPGGTRAGFLSARDLP
jgi:hypothetical protein